MLQKPASLFSSDPHVGQPEISWRILSFMSKGLLLCGMTVTGENTEPYRRGGDDRQLHHCSRNILCAVATFQASEVKMGRSPLSLADEGLKKVQIILPG